MAWMGILGEEGRLRKELYVVRGIASMPRGEEVMGGGGKVPEYSGWDISSSSDGDHEIRLKLIEDVFGGCLAEFVDLRFDLLAAIPADKSIRSPSCLWTYPAAPGGEGRLT